MVWMLEALKVEKEKDLLCVLEAKSLDLDFNGGENRHWETPSVESGNSYFNSVRSGTFTRTRSTNTVSMGPKENVNV